jgi:hypothetical protein
MTFRDILLVFHIAGVGAWFGANIVQAVVPPMAARVGIVTLAGWYRITSVLARRLYIPAALVILVTGVLLVMQTDAYGFGDTFVAIGFGMIILGAVLGMVIFGPGGEAAAAAVETEDVTKIRSAVAKLTSWGVVDTLLLLFTIAAMVLRLD